MQFKIVREIINIVHSNVRLLLRFENKRRQLSRNLLSFNRCKYSFLITFMSLLRLINWYFDSWDNILYYTMVSGQLTPPHIHLNYYLYYTFLFYKYRQIWKASFNSLNLDKKLCVFITRSYIQFNKVSNDSNRGLALSSY